MAGTSGLIQKESLIFERSVPGRRGDSLPNPEVELVDPSTLVPSNMLRQGIPGFPEVSEVDVVRHFTRLSTWNYGLDTGIYPLGSCTMKYNPKVNEWAARLPGFAGLHPLMPARLAQGSLAMMGELEAMLGEITGMAAVTLQPAAGAHGELTGLMLIRAHFCHQGETRDTILVPDSSHGTNPASSAVCGFKVEVLRSSADGTLSPEVVQKAMGPHVAALMITNPNTLGIFEPALREIGEVVHGGGGLLYMDGANMNAMMGITRPGDAGVDVMQLNLHKTFATPHGGGGPGSGPVAVAAVLEPYLPVPRLLHQGEWSLDWDRPKSIGRVRAFYGNVAVMIRAYAYLRELGASGLKRATELAVLNANYLRCRLADKYHLASQSPTMHEVVFSDASYKKHGIKVTDISKGLIDRGFHPPTNAFPLIVSGALMIEPTETESKESLDSFIEALLAIHDEAERNPEGLTQAPHVTHVGRLDEVAAAKEPVVRWAPPGEEVALGRGGATRRRK